jgi:hypothetical protein
LEQEGVGALLVVVVVAVLVNINTIHHSQYNQELIAW